VGIAGSGIVPLWAVLIHRGRRSGQQYRTPIAIRRIPNGFIVPLPFGPRTDWCRNVRAASGCQIRWKGRTYDATAPEVVDAPAAAPAFPRVLRIAIGILGITQFLRLRA
jgi:deazaflavin-dependent oxidoreductase (nitroreductase family)